MINNLNDDVEKDKYEYINKYNYDLSQFQDVKMADVPPGEGAKFYGNNANLVYDPNSIIQIPDLINYQKPPDEINPPKYNYNQKTYEYKPIIYDKSQLKYRFIINSKRFMDPSRFYLVLDIENNNVNNFLQLDGSHHSLIKTITFIHNGVVIEKINNYNIITNFINDITYKSYRYHNNYQNSKYDLCYTTKEDVIQPIEYGTHLIYNPPQFEFDYTSCRNIVDGKLNFEPQNKQRYVIPIFSYLFGNSTQQDFKLVPLSLFSRGLEVEIEFNENAFFVPVFNAKLSDIVNASINNDDYVIYRACLKELEHLKKITDQLISKPITYANKNKNFTKNKTTVSKETHDVITTTSVGNCLFEALSIELFNDLSKASELRYKIVNYLSTKGPALAFEIKEYIDYLFKRVETHKNAERGVSLPFIENKHSLTFNYWRINDDGNYLLSNYNIESFNKNLTEISDIINYYINNISKNGYNGGALELYIVSKLYNRPIEIWAENDNRYVFEAIFSPHMQKEPITLLYSPVDVEPMYMNGHYDLLKQKEKNYGFRGIYFQPSDFFNIELLKNNMDQAFKSSYLYNVIIESINVKTLKKILTNVGTDKFTTYISENVGSMFNYNPIDNNESENQKNFNINKNIQDLFKAIQNEDVNSLLQFIDPKFIESIINKIRLRENKSDEIIENIQFYTVGTNETILFNPKNNILKPDFEINIYNKLHEIIYKYIETQTNKEDLKKIFDEVKISLSRGDVQTGFKDYLTKLLTKLNIHSLFNCNIDKNFDFNTTINNIRNFDYKNEDTMKEILTYIPQLKLYKMFLDEILFENIDLKYLKEKHKLSNYTLFNYVWQFNSNYLTLINVNHSIILDNNNTIWSNIISYLKNTRLYDSFDDKDIIELNELLKKTALLNNAADTNAMKVFNRQQSIYHYNDITYYSLDDKIIHIYSYTLYFALDFYVKILKGKINDIDKLMISLDVIIAIMIEDNSFVVKDEHKLISDVINDILDANKFKNDAFKLLVEKYVNNFDSIEHNTFKEGLLIFSSHLTRIPTIKKAMGTMLKRLLQFPQILKSYIDLYITINEDKQDYSEHFYNTRLACTFETLSVYKSYIGKDNFIKYVTQLNMIDFDFFIDKVILFGKIESYLFNSGILSKFSVYKKNFDKDAIENFLKFLEKPEIISIVFIQKITNIYGPEQTILILDKYIPDFFDPNKKYLIKDLLYQNNYIGIHRCISQTFINKFKSLDDILNFNPFNIKNRISNNLTAENKNRFEKLLKTGKLLENAFSYTSSENILQTLIAILSKTQFFITNNKDQFLDTNLLYKPDYNIDILDRLLNYSIISTSKTNDYIGGGPGDYLYKLSNIVSYSGNFLINLTKNGFNKIVKKYKDTVNYALNAFTSKAINIFKSTSLNDMYKEAYESRPELYITLKSFAASLNITNDDFINHIISSFKNRKLSLYYIIDLLILEKMRVKLFESKNPLPISYIELFYRLVYEGMIDNLNLLKKHQFDVRVGDFDDRIDKFKDFLNDNTYDKFAFNIKDLEILIIKLNISPINLVNLHFEIAKSCINNNDYIKIPCCTYTLILFGLSFIKKDLSHIIDFCTKNEKIVHFGINNIPGDIKNKVKDKEELNKQLEDVQKQYKETQEKMITLDKEIIDKNNSLKNNQTNLDNEYYKLTELEKRNNFLKNKRSYTALDIDEKSELINYEDNKKIINDEIATKSAEINSLIDNIKNHKRELNEKSNKKKSFLDEIASLKKKIEEKIKEIIENKTFTDFFGVTNMKKINAGNLDTIFKKIMSNEGLDLNAVNIADDIKKISDKLEKYYKKIISKLTSPHDSVRKELDNHSNKDWLKLSAYFNVFFIQLNKISAWNADNTQKQLIFQKDDLNAQNKYFFTAAGKIIKINYFSESIVHGFFNKISNENTYKYNLELPTNVNNCVMVSFIKYNTLELKDEDNKILDVENITLQDFYSYFIKENERIGMKLSTIPLKILNTYSTLAMNVYQMLQVVSYKLNNSFYLGIYIIIYKVFIQILKTIDAQSNINKIDIGLILTLIDDINMYIKSYNTYNNTSYETMDEVILDLEDPQTYIRIRQRMQDNYNIFYKKQLTRQSDFELLNNEANYGDLNISRNYNIADVKIHTTEFDFRDYKTSDIIANGYSRTFKRFMIIHKYDFDTEPPKRLDLTIQRNTINNFYQIFHHTNYRKYPTARQLCRYSRKIKKYGLEIGSEIYPNNFINGNNSTYSKCNQFLDNLNKCFDITMSSINRFNYCLDESTNMYITKKTFGVPDTSLFKFSPQTNLHFQYTFGYHNEIIGKNIIGISFDYLSSRIGENFNLLQQKVIVHCDTDIKKEDDKSDIYESYIIVEYDDYAIIDSNGMIIQKTFADIQI